jgi:hypothetical protein
MQNFSVNRRNYGHWDVYGEKKNRIFTIRGAPGKYCVDGDHEKDGVSVSFKTLSACMTYICDDLMYELIFAEGQNPKIIESWNLNEN